MDAWRGNWKTLQDLSFHELLSRHLNFQPNWQCLGQEPSYALLLINPKVTTKKNVLYTNSVTMAGPQPAIEYKSSCSQVTATQPLRLLLSPPETKVL